MLSARPDLKKYTALRFRQEVKRHADAAGPGEVRGAGVYGGPGPGATADPGLQRPAPADGGLPDRAGGVDREPAAAPMRTEVLSGDQIGLGISPYEGTQSVELLLPGLSGQFQHA